MILTQPLLVGIQERRAIKVIPKLLFVRTLAATALTAIVVIVAPASAYCLSELGLLELFPVRFA